MRRSAQRTIMGVLVVIAAAMLVEDRPRSAASEAVEALPHAHAHNDYLHTRPLHDALDHGFCSVEADIFLVDGELLVAHTRRELNPERTLEALYLEPLRRRIDAMGGRIYPDGPPLTLLIDIKSDAESTYTHLHDLLTEYSEILTRVEDGEVHPGPVEVVISGNRPVELMRGQSPRYAGIDGRLRDLDSDVPAHLMPLISDRWTSHFRWRGEGPIDDAQRAKLRAIVARAHQRDRRLRFWATPERESLWQELREADVDLIGTDDLSRLARFLRTRGKGRVSQLRADWLDPNGPVINVAHRGMWGHAPENSLACIRRAIDADIPALEIDVRKTKDGVLVLMHDRTIDRTTNGTGNVGDLTIEQLRQFRLKGPTGPTDEPIPTLAEALRTAHGRVLVNLDMKHDAFDDAIEILRQTGTTSSAIIKHAGRLESLVALAERLPAEVLFMPIYFVRDKNAEAAYGSLDRLLAGGRTSCVEFVFQRSVGDATIRRFTELCHRHGVRAWANSLGNGPAGRYPDGDPESWARMTELGINVIQTDYPVRLQRWLDQ